MDPTLTFHDPLSINFARQIRILLSQIPPDSCHVKELASVTSQTDALNTLSRLLAVSAFTSSVAAAFRPLLIDLCARWLHCEDHLEDKFAALCFLIEFHQELFPVLYAFLRKLYFESSPLNFMDAVEAVDSLDSQRLHRVLLAYHRLLHANRLLPNHLFWSLAPLSKLIHSPHSDNGARLLAVRCYASHSGMSEAERDLLMSRVLGEFCGVDCPIKYGESMDGTILEVDGWLLPTLELERINDARSTLVEEQQDFYFVEDSETFQPLDLSSLCSSIANVHGILLLRSSTEDPRPSPVVPTQSAIQSLRSLAINISLRVPTLLTSLPSSGKSLFLSHLASLLHSTVENQIVTIHLADTSLDPRSLLGSYVSSPVHPGTFEWKEGLLVRAMREGRWVVFEDIDRGSNEVLGLIKPLTESMRLGNWIGCRASLEIPNRGRVEAEEGFAIFATRSCLPSRNGQFPAPVFFGAQKFCEVTAHPPTIEEVRAIIEARFSKLAGNVSRGIIRLWEDIQMVDSMASALQIGLRDLEKFCMRVTNLLPESYQSTEPSSETGDVVSLGSIFTHPTLREDIFLKANDVFFGRGAATAAARTHYERIATIVADSLGLDTERRLWLLQGKTPEFEVEKDVNGETVSVFVGRSRLYAKSRGSIVPSPSVRPFAMHKPALVLLSRIATAVSLSEPVLLTGETGTGKTSIVTHLATLLRRPLVSLNLSHQTESSDLLGGFKPVDARVPGASLYQRFLELFGGTFSRRKNAQFEESVRKAVVDAKWKRAIGLWREATRLAKERIRAKFGEDARMEQSSVLDSSAPRKRQKTDHPPLRVSESAWDTFLGDVDEFDVQFAQGTDKFSFDFVEGPLVRALRNGDWILLDEVNLASPETLECLTSILHGPAASLTLTEQGSLEPVPRHPDFRLFACMNPATDVGKKDLPPNIRSRFTEIEVSPPDADRDTLISIITQYIGPCAVGDKAAIMDVAEFYLAVKNLAAHRQIADGSNHRPHYSMRTLARALTFASDVSSTYGLRRALWEGCLMAFTMILDAPSSELVNCLARKHILSGVRNPGSLLAREPLHPQPSSDTGYVKFGPFYLEKGPLQEDLMEDYIMTPSVERKLIDLARIILTRRFPVLIEGPTSSGKTSSVEYLARRTGHHFIRINNHEHTDIQEYLGSYVSDSTTGKLVFKDGLLVRALRNGHWVVLDELNLAPTDVLEALNRLLDDNRELVIPETQEIIRPHPHFLLFATQNPPGLYAGRKMLSRAFRNRFLEVHFDDVPQTELETILCQRCRIAPSYSNRIVSVFRELQKRRQSSRVFESKQSFATLRDLFRWATRNAVGYQELAENGFMLLAERARQQDDRIAVKEVIEHVMKVQIEEEAMYDFQNRMVDFEDFIGCQLPASSGLVWTAAMRRLFVLVARALRFQEPVLLVGETGSGKTSVCQIYAEALLKRLVTLNCHQNTETADLIGGLRPLRNRSATATDIATEAESLLGGFNTSDFLSGSETLLARIKDSIDISSDTSTILKLKALRQKVIQHNSMFSWADGPLVNAMRSGDVFLLDEISLADDSVLERLNSVLEPARSIVLAERGGNDDEHPVIYATDGFKLVATMNPGGDFGKKELSPALRNRFTEIWVPSVTDRHDLELIVDHSWSHAALQLYTSRLLDFTEWLGGRINDRSICGLRDILAWVDFSNSAFSSQDYGSISLNEIFHHAAHMTFLDGLAALPQLSTFSRAALHEVKGEAIATLQSLAPLTEPEGTSAFAYDPIRYTQLGPFAILKGPKKPSPQKFNFQAPTTRENTMRVVRACQVHKPILLEGSPGVGKTSLISALANLTGHHLCRINLSDQTDLMDLFGSDLPVDDGGPQEFAWKDAEFLKAVQEGHWVLLDEMNLAPQAVLEGLNAILDHRGSVFIPELDRSFVRHPAFRIFAAQNPLQQGGGRKGLPKSFINRFTKVYMEELSPEDLLLVCHHVLPECPVDQLRMMITYNTRLSEEIARQSDFALEGRPWEFNLRDVIRWGELLQCSGFTRHPVDYLAIIYLDRFRTVQDRNRARLLFEEVFTVSTSHLECFVQPLLSPSHVQINLFQSGRENHSRFERPGCFLQSCSSMLEAFGTCLRQSWLVIIGGRSGSGKSELVRMMASLTGNHLCEISVNSATDTSDILGGFEQVDDQHRILAVAKSVLLLAEENIRTVSGSTHETSQHYEDLRRAIKSFPRNISPDSVIRSMIATLRGLKALGPLQKIKQQVLNDEIQTLNSAPHAPGRFEWVDGPLVHAIKHGYWLVLDDANLCNPSVLDRLNSLCESNGTLTLSERGLIDGEMSFLKPHPNFRLFMTADHQYGELSRAMRNRGIELGLITPLTPEDKRRLVGHHRLPRQVGEVTVLSISEHEAIRRGICLPSSNDSVSAGERLLSCTIGEDDGPTSMLINQSPFFTKPVQNIQALLHFFARAVVPNLVPLFCRFISVLSPEIREHLQPLLVLIQCVHSSSIMRAISRLRDPFVKNHHLPSGFLDNQSVDIYMTCQPCHNCSAQAEEASHRKVLKMLEVFVEFTLHQTGVTGREGDNDVFRLNLGPRQSDKPAHEQILTSVASFLGQLRMSMSNILGSENLDQSMTDAEANVLIGLLKYSRQLRKTVTQEMIDFSAVQALSKWIVESLRGCSAAYCDLGIAAEKLEEALSLTTGQGIAEIWSTLFTPSISTSCQAPAELCHGDPCVLGLQLRALLGFGGRDASMGLTSTIESLISATCSIPPGSPHCALLYKQALVGLQGGKEMLPSEITRLQKQWLKAVWDTGQVNDINGPSLLLHPIHLWSTLQKSGSSQVSLLLLGDHESYLNRHVELTVAQSFIHSSRLHELLSLLLQCIVVMYSCFPTLAKDAAGQVLSEVRWDDLSSVMKALTQLESVADGVLGAAFRRFLQPSIQILRANQDSRQSMLMALGRCWIMLSRLLVHLFVPDSPIDPAAVIRHSVHFWETEENSLFQQKQLHTSFEERTAGNHFNSVTSYLDERIEQTRQNLLHYPVNIPDRSDVARLHAFWSEVIQFQAQVLSPSRTDPLMSLIEAGSPFASAREAVLQETISAFCQRLEAAYPDFDDLTGPIIIACFYFRFGLRLIRSSSDATSEPLTRFASILGAFPSVQGADSLYLERDTYIPPEMTPFEHVMLRLTAMQLFVSLGMSPACFIMDLEVTFEQAYRLWKIDRSRQDQKLEESQSLYKRKKFDHDDATELEAEEREFLEMFPMFENALDPVESLRSQGGKRKAGDVDGNPSLRLANAFCAIFADFRPNFNASRTVTKEFERLRRVALTSTLESNMTSLADHLDSQSLPIQFNLLRDEVILFKGNRDSKKTAFNFYTDTHIPEVKNALGIVEALQTRLQLLIQEWPDQMVLQHLKDHCEIFVNFSIDSPLAKILSALEQILLQTEDWEAFASRETTLKLHRQALTSLIVDWRRLELSCWQELLQSELQTFISNASEFWFHIFEVTFQGTLAAADEGIQDGTDHLDAYIRQLPALLDEFIVSSPLGQFQVRIGLLRCYERFIGCLGSSKSGPHSAALGRVRLILYWTWTYYDLFSPQLLGLFAEQKLSIEKEVQDFIKLASWKDVNVQALKQSARKTHHDLYKLIRKFRGLMRQPVAEKLAFVLAGEAESSHLEANVIHPPRNFMMPMSDFPTSENAAILPKHLKNLTRTFGNFNSLVNNRIRVFLKRYSASNVDSLAVVIISTIDALSKESVPPRLAKERQEKYRKALLVRKRKAWSDLLKELKRSGLAAHLRSDVLARQRDEHWIREQPLISLPMLKAISFERGEIYLNRLRSALPSLRDGLKNHHSDISTRELQRGIMLLESGFSMALEGRSCLAEGVHNFDEFRQISYRLTDISEASRLAYFDFPLHRQVQYIQSILQKSAHAIAESADGIKAFYDLKANIEVPAAIMEKLATHSSIIEEYCNRIATIAMATEKLPSSILLGDEHAFIIDVINYLQSMPDHVHELLMMAPNLQYILHPLQIWMKDLTVPSFSLSCSADPVVDNLDIDAAIQSLLLTIQSLVSQCSEVTGDDSDDHDRENFIRDGLRTISRFTRLLNMDSLLTQLRAAALTFTKHGQEEVQKSLRRLLPFLHSYTHFAGEQLASHSQWTKAVFKLDYVVCSVLHTVGKQGFCQPAEESESATGGEGTEHSDGLGLGEGTGSENVSNEIEDEGQVEGLKGEEEGTGEPQEHGDDDNAIEMSGDLGGAMEDGPEHEESDDVSGAEDADEPDEEIGTLDSSAIDEKLWGDESGSSNSQEANDAPKNQPQPPTDNVDLAAKENEDSSERPKDRGDQAASTSDFKEMDPDIASVDDEKTMGNNEEEQEEGDGTEANGAPVDKDIPNAEILDLPDDMQLEEQYQPEMEGNEDERSDEDELMDDMPADPVDDPSNVDATDDVPQSGEDFDHGMPPQDPEDDNAAANVAENDEMVVSIPDVSAGEGTTTDRDVVQAGEEEDGSQEQNSKSSSGNKKPDNQERLSQSDSRTRDVEPGQQLDQTDDSIDTSANAGVSGADDQLGGSYPQQPGDAHVSRPRPLGDSSNEVLLRSEEILDGNERRSEAVQQYEEKAPAQQLEYAHTDDVDQDMQALGSAGDEQAAKLNDLKLIASESSAIEISGDMVVDLPATDSTAPALLTTPRPEPIVDPARSEVDGAIAHFGLHADKMTESVVSQPGGTLSSNISLDTEETDINPANVEMELRQWQAQGQPDYDAENIWRLYESLTHDLSYSLCEHLRLILEPTLATRLKGDYRTGKRLNMKKIIPYIASDYTKDKIWLRRTKPSQREYQVLLAIDDSKSMAESHSIHLAYQTLALVSKALSRLEVGDIAIAMFGERVDILHGFDEGTFTDEAGKKVLNAFKFNQKATNIFALLETSLRVLEAARERRSMGSSTAADLWQLEIIISDGICQDHDRLRALLRKAEERNVMIVFVVIDSLHSAAPDPATQISKESNSIQNSILSMSQVAYKMVGGKMELQMERYMDSFPFNYYIVLRNVEALPEVLSSTLRQFFERISEE